MNPKEKDSANIFTGKWELKGVYVNVPAKGWIAETLYDPGTVAWEFDLKMVNGFPSGQTVFEGILRESYKGGPAETTEYMYVPDECKLYIDRSDYLPDGFCDTCINDIYRVEAISQAEYWLYDLEDVRKEPEDYMIRVRIEKQA